jgi:hypothetical protein
LSGVGKVCGVDWQKRNFEPMMSSLRARGLNERQVAVAGALHGFGMALAERGSGQCSNEQRQQIQQALDFKR